jgi:outer membrane protein OmpA-like peptidoglycan-associated protein
MKVNRTATLSLALVFGLLTVACASKKYVREQVGTSEGKTGERVAGVETSIEEAQMQLRQHDTRITTASKTAQEALERAVAAGKLAEGRFLFETVLTDDKVKFGFDQTILSDEAKAALDDFAAQLKAEDKNVYVEIQGHTDETGEDAYNEQLGFERAQAVRYYLSKQGGIPLHRMEAISYGETAPVADNQTREGRLQNRRVALIVLQ